MPALVGRFSDGGQLVAQFLRLERIAHVDGAETGIEPRRQGRPSCTMAGDAGK